MKISSVIVFLTLLAITAGMSLGGLGANLRCQCIQTESKPIGRHIQKIQIIPAGSHCSDTEIIATLKQTGHEVCLDTKAPWVKKVIAKILANNKR
ncbi:permeability factor 2 [Hypomesus transpacificus]|uniref:permeability factor 2 n=1 Tax=Hypomesus transpacificus TaxID=137520 RepID=UPI001F081A23|nr:permeability factor 2 [Hypomesus transpacificus]